MVQEKEETLKLLGLSPTQAHVYLTLIKSGKTSAKNLAKQSEVACPDIYGQKQRKRLMATQQSPRN